MTKKIRRYDLDWLRVFVFGLLIFYHVGMFFVPWGWHIKNPVTYKNLVWPMLFVNQWRLPILFVISGMGTSFALSFRTSKQFAIERLKRLGIPLVFGMLFIVPPQVYIERLHHGAFEGSYWQYYTTVAFQGVYPVGNISWHHLWFLPYLLLFALVLTPLMIYWRNHPDNSFANWLRKQLARNWGIYWFIIPLYLVEAFMEPFFPTTLALIGDWFTLTNYLLLFFFGFMLIQVKEAFWEALEQVQYKALAIGVISFLLFVYLLHIPDNIYRHFTEALVKVINLWSWILVLFGVAAKWLNRSSPLLSYCNQAVYPFYILHQTITIILGYYFMDWGVGLGIKFTVMSIGTFLGSWVLYEGIRRITWLRPLFGLKNS